MLTLDKQKLIFAGIIALALFLMALVAGWTRQQERRAGSTGLAGTATALTRRSAEVALGATNAAMVAATIEILATSEAAVSATTVAIEQGNGQTVITAEGLQLEIIAVNYDAWRVIKATNYLNAPPHPGKRMLMVKIEVTNVGQADDPLPAITDSDFRIIGERERVYTTFDKETRCGVLPDQLSGALLPGDVMSGNICIQVPVEEQGLQLVYWPFVADENRLFLPIPDPKPSRVGR